MGEIKQGKNYSRLAGLEEIGIAEQGEYYCREKASRFTKCREKKKKQRQSCLLLK